MAVAFGLSRSRAKVCVTSFFFIWTHLLSVTNYKCCLYAYSMDRLDSILLFCPDYVPISIFHVLHSDIPKKLRPPPPSPQWRVTSGKGPVGIFFKRSRQNLEPLGCKLQRFRQQKTRFFCGMSHSVSSCLTRFEGHSSEVVKRSTVVTQLPSLRSQKLLLNLSLPGVTNIKIILTILMQC